MRTPITLKIKFKSSSLDQFIERYSVDVSRGGIFIRTKEPLPVGTQLRFEFQLQDASSLIAGDGTVVWIREHDPARQGVAPGMGVRFDKLHPESQKVLDKILHEKSKRGDAQLESRFDAGVRASASASGTLSAQAPRVAAHNDFGGGDSKVQTPLPGAVPGLETPGDEFGNESTRVMQNELVQSLADRTRGVSDEGSHAFSDPEPTRKASVEELKLAVQGSVPSVELKREAKVEIAPEVVEAKPEAPKPVEPRPEPIKLVEKKAEPVRAVEEKTEKTEPVKPLEVKRPAAFADEPPRKAEPRREEPRPAVAATPAPARKRSSAGWLYAAVAAVAIAGGYTYMRSQAADQAQPTPPVPAVATAPAATAPAAAAPASGQGEAPKPTEEATPPSGAKVEPAKLAEGARSYVAEAAAKEPEGLKVPIGSDPPGATVTVDGKPVGEPTPTTLSGLDAMKSYDVRVALKGFHEWKVKLKPKSGDKIDAALVPNEKVVEVATTPSGAEVVLDGKRVGRTPYTIHKLDLSKAHALEVKRAGFVSQTRSISASDSFESKGDKDVLAVALTLEAAPKPAAADRPVAPKSVATKKPAVKKPSETPAAATEKPTEAAASSVGGEPAADKPTADKPEKPAATEKPAAAEKPAAEKPAAATERPAADKPAADKTADKPGADKATIKVPGWTKQKPAEGGETAPPTSDTPAQ
jgi:uncharacterized protein (TIGR02266 family)